MFLWLINRWDFLDVFSFVALSNFWINLFTKKNPLSYIPHMHSYKWATLSGPILWSNLTQFLWNTRHYYQAIVVYKIILNNMTQQNSMRLRNIGVEGCIDFLLIYIKFLWRDFALLRVPGSMHAYSVIGTQKSGQYSKHLFILSKNKSEENKMPIICNVNSNYSNSTFL